MSTPSNSGRGSLDDLIQQYNQELLRYHQRNRVRVPLTPQADKAAEEPKEDRAAAASAEAESTVETASSAPEEAQAVSPPPAADAGLSWEEIPASAESGVHFVRPDPSLDDWSRTAASMDTPAEDRMDEADPMTLVSPGASLEESLADEEALRFEEPPATDTGYLIVQAYTARRALPVEGAHVTVSRTLPDGSTLKEIAVTDQNGKTRSIPLPAANPELSQKPGIEHPYITYNIQITADGYIPVRDFNVPLFGGITAIQPVELIPIPEGGVTDDIAIDEGGPQDL